MPKCTTACKCTGGGCFSSVEQDEFYDAMAVDETETQAAAVLVDEDEDEFPPCVTPAFNGEDQVSSDCID